LTKFVITEVPAQAFCLAIAVVLQEFNWF